MTDAKLVNGSLATTANGVKKSVEPPQKVYKWEIAWTNLIALSIIHALALYGFFLRYSFESGYTVLFWKILTFLSTLGVTGGAHRLWSHRTYTANMLCQTILAMMMSLTYQNSIYTWCRDHRMHHKYSETDADPHNAKRGFFFCHMGWLLVRKHPEVRAKGKTIDMSDLEANPLVMFQHKYYYLWVFTIGVLFSTAVPVYCFGESFRYAFFTGTIYRYVISVHLTWCINSLAHLYGYKPYDKAIGPTENPMMMYMGFGEGFHNYHHTFPWDYKAAELGSDTRNTTTMMIDFFAWLGWVTERKTAKLEDISSKIKKSGDGTHEPRASGFYKLLVNVPKREFINSRNLIFFFLYLYML